MLRFATLKGLPYGPDYLGSIGCFDKWDMMIARCVRNRLELEDPNFEPLTVQEALAMLDSGDIDPARLECTASDPALWNCWEVLVKHHDPAVLQRAIATAYNSLLVVEHLTSPFEE